LRISEKQLREASEQLQASGQQFKEANIRLQELDKLKSMFIASMSHELRTPLNSIIGFTGIILQGMSGEITAEQRKQLTMVKTSAAHLLALINDVIDVSKIEAGKVELAIEEFDLAALVQQVKKSFETTADKQGLMITLEMPEKLIVRSDERRTKQVIINFVSNAIKFTDKGRIEIKVSKRDESAEVSVADTGVGIRKGGINKLFQAFGRIYTENRLTEGSGLGLYLSKKITDLLGGKIRAESNFGKGSVFTFTLPLKYQEIEK
jgi:signal transduction histidine kinase